jgi:hypothetical protein
MVQVKKLINNLFADQPLLSLRFRGVFLLEYVIGCYKINDTLNETHDRRDNRPAQKKIDEPPAPFAKVKFMYAQAAQKYGE